MTAEVVLIVQVPYCCYNLKFYEQKFMSDKEVAFSFVSFLASSNFIFPLHITTQRVSSCGKK